MALAILEFVGVEKGNARFTIDTGTSKYYKLKVGRSFERRHDIDWVDDVHFSTPLGINAMGGGMLNSHRDVFIPVRYFDEGNEYVQLFSFKTPEGKSPAFSRVVRVPAGSALPLNPRLRFSPSFSLSTAMTMTETFQSPRTIPCTTQAEQYAASASLEDLLSGLVRMAGPMVMKMLGDGQGSQAPEGLGGGAGTMAMLLHAILGSIPGMQSMSASVQQSIVPTDERKNRFADGANSGFSKQFIFGIDDALLGTMIGPVLQMLPQLMNAANQKRVQLKQADNKLITDILSNVNQRMMLQQLLEAQRQAPAGQTAGGADVTQLLQMLQQAQAASPPAASPSTAAAPVAIARSLSAAPESNAVLSKSVVSFVVGDPVLWNGEQKAVFAKPRGIQLRIRLNVPPPAPKTSLPKAIVRIIFKHHSNAEVWTEKTFKLKGVSANSDIPLAFTPEELAPIAANRVIVCLAEMRWLSPQSGQEYKALGSTEIVLVNQYFLKDAGIETPVEQELTDMTRFRPFWNKIWEAPLLDGGGHRGDGNKKYLWEFDVNAKYSILLSAEHTANGLMQTKLLQGKKDPDSVTDRTEGRMKAGIELSVAELNKLLPLWNDQAVLEQAKLEAFTSKAFARVHGGEFVYNMKLKGGAADRGMIWIVPTFKLFEFTLCTSQKTDDAGQVIAVGEEKAKFPLPVAARAIGLKSES